jgi:hypothetical protein
MTRLFRYRLLCQVAFDEFLRGFHNSAKIA